MRTIIKQSLEGNPNKSISEEQIYNDLEKILTSYPVKVIMGCFFIMISMFSPSNGKMCAILCMTFFVLSVLLTAYLSFHVCSSGLSKPIKLVYVGIKNYQSKGLDYALLDCSRVLHNVRTSFSGAFLFPPSRCALILIYFYIIQTIRKKAA